MLLAGGLVLTGCGVLTIDGSGTIASETRDVEAFDRVVATGSADVVVRLGESPSVVVEADDNLIEFVTTEVRGDELVLGTDTDGRVLSPTATIRFTVTATDLVGVDLDGSGSITVEDVTGDRLDLSVSGSGNVDAVADVATLALSIDGSGDVTVAGTADTLDVSVSGSGAVDAEALAASTGSVDMSGSGTAIVAVSDALTVDVSGSGNVEYVGRPDLSVDVSGSGAVNNRS